MELPRIAQVLAGLRGCSLEALTEQTTANACAALPRLAGLEQEQRRSAADTAPMASAGA